MHSLLSTRLHNSRSCPSSSLEPLRSNNSLLLMAAGAYRTSPAASLRVNTGFSLLHYHHLILTIEFLASILQRLQIPTYNYIFLPPPPIYLPRFSHWEDLQAQVNKLAQSKDTPVPWALFNQPTRSHQEIIFKRLRVGLTCLTLLPAL